MTSLLSSVKQFIKFFLASFTVVFVLVFGYQVVTAPPLTDEQRVEREQIRALAEARKENERTAQRERTERQLMIVRVEDSIRQQFRVPGSVQFHESFYRDHPAFGHVVCGMVNAQNGFGGMSGWQPYVSINAELVSVNDPASYNTICIN